MPGGSDRVIAFLTAETLDPCLIFALLPAFVLEEGLGPSDIGGSHIRLALASGISALKPAASLIAGARPAPGKKDVPRVIGTGTGLNISRPLCMKTSDDDLKRPPQGYFPAGTTGGFFPRPRLSVYHGHTPPVFRSLRGLPVPPRR